MSFPLFVFAGDKCVQASQVESRPRPLCGCLHFPGGVFRDHGIHGDVVGFARHGVHDVLRERDANFSRSRLQKEAVIPSASSSQSAPALVERHARDAPRRVFVIQAPLRGRNARMGFAQRVAAPHQIRSKIGDGNHYIRILHGIVAGKEHSAPPVQKPLEHSTQVWLVGKRGHVGAKSAGVSHPGETKQPSADMRASRIRIVGLGCRSPSPALQRASKMVLGRLSGRLIQLSSTMLSAARIQADGEFDNSVLGSESAENPPSPIHHSCGNIRGFLADSDFQQEKSPFE